MKNISNIIIKGSISSISKEERIFSGFGSVQLIDKQGDYLPISEFKPVLEKLMSMGHKIPVQDSHSNHNCGEIVKFEFKNDDGGRPGLYLTAKIYSRFPSDDDIWNCIKNGEYKGFSLGGKAGEKIPICDENGCYNLLKNLELWEFSIVSEPANQSALIDNVNKLAKSHKTYKVHVKKCNPQLRAIDKGWLSDFGEYVEEDWVKRHFVPGQKPESDWSDKIKELWRKKQEDYDRGKFIHKAKVYVKNPNEAPKGAKVQEGKRGGHYYESNELTQSTLRPKRELSEEEIWRIINSNDNPTALNQFIQHPNWRIRIAIANKTNQEGLYKLINDNSSDVRRAVAERIDQVGLHKMIKDINYDVLRFVAKRIDQSGIYEMAIDSKIINSEAFQYSGVKAIIAERINLDDLRKIYNTKAWKISDDINDLIVHRILLSTLNSIVKPFEKTGKIELNSDVTNTIRSIMNNNLKSTNIISLTDEFYNVINNGEFHQFHLNSKSAWERSSSSDLALLLKDSIKRQFGGDIKYHDAVKDIENKLNELYRQYPREIVDKYVQIQKKLTRAYLDAMFPDTDEIIIYRGTTQGETKDIGSDYEVLVQSNPLSSWTIKGDVADRFARYSGGQGIVLKMLIHKDDIWSTFMSHAYYEGNEREILLIGNKDRKARKF